MITILETREIKKYFPVTKGFLFSKTTGFVKAVDGVNLTIKAGETIGLVGESGCGKTTVSKLILMLENLSGGSILFQGKDLEEYGVKELKTYRNSVQAVFQNPLSSLDPKMRIGKIIKEPLSVGNHFSKSEIEERIALALREVGMDPDDSKKYPHEFSGGQRQRIAIARALITKPQLIILDEPVSSQDVSIRAQLMNLLKDIQGDLEISYMFIAHDLATVRYMSDRIDVMYLGKIVERAPSDDLIMNPVHPYTKALISASLPADPDSRSLKMSLSGEVPSPLNPPSGCRFRTRCSNAIRECAEKVPRLKEIYPGHFVACLKLINLGEING